MKRYGWLVGILVMGAFLRLLLLGHQSLWLDEAFSVIIARRDWGQIIVSTAQDTMPPLYYFVLRAFLALGDGEFVVRLPSALWGMVTIPLLYALGRRLFSEKVGLMSALLLAVNPFHIFYSQEARMYSQLGFCTLLSAFFFLRAWQEGKKRDWLSFALSTVAALYTQNMAVLSLMALGVFALLHWREAMRKWRTLAIVLGSVILLFLPWLVYLPEQMARVGTQFWAETPSVLELFTTLSLFLFGHALSPAMVIAALIVGLYGVFLALFLGWRALREEGANREPLSFVLCLFAVPMGSSFLISQLWPIFLARTFIVSAFALLVLLAWGLVRMPRLLAALLIVPGLALVSLSLYNFYANPAYAKPPMREAAGYLQTHFRAGDTVIHTSDSSYLTFVYYAPELDRHFLIGDPDYERETTRGRTGRIAGIRPESLDEIVSGKSRLWLVVTLDHNPDYQKELKRQFDRRYPLLDATDVGGIGILLYDLNRGQDGKERELWGKRGAMGLVGGRRPDLAVCHLLFGALHPPASGVHDPRL
ncbi:MAG: glycosyltransferase family 39 protein [Anaerolineae bacterium]|jgi:uncharacterized membrane protein|nr:glycosyltransferase family 39 protein [Anaerolineae bacterium]MDH7472446.1 glycosyltransferase family 39 protein [Anaerolineae bacterium]